MIEQYKFVGDEKITYEMESKEFFSSSCRNPELETLALYQKEKAIESIMLQYMKATKDGDWKYHDISVSEYTDNDGVHFDLKLVLVKPDTRKEKVVK